MLFYTNVLHEVVLKAQGVCQRVAKCVSLGEYQY